MTLLVGHAGHWLVGLGFAAAPVSVIAAVIVLAIVDRRRGPRWTAEK